MDSFHAQMKAEAQRLHDLDEAGKAAQINLNRLAKEDNPDAKANELQKQNEQEMQKQQEAPKALM